MRKIVSLCLMLVMSMMIWADRTLYFVPNSNWTQANAKFAVYCFENEESEWSDFMTLVAGETNVYTTTIPDSYTQVIFCRMNSAATECNWGSKWNQSADITLPTDGKDMFTLADGWDQISGTWSNYAAPQQQDTTNVSPLANKHFYLNGEFLNWDTQKALEFTLADSLFTLTVDTLSGIFKVMTARNWEAPDYGGDYNVNLTLGVPYTLTERGYDLSCSTIYLNAELQLRLVGNDVILTLVSGTPVQQDTTGTPEPVATPHFYLTGNEAFVGAGKAAWNKEDGYVSYGDTLTLNLGAGTYEVQLINANDEWKGYDALSQPIAENITTNSWGNICFYMAQAGQVTFIYKTDNTFLIQGTFAKPRYHFYYIGTAVNWIVNDALEFEYQDSVYTLSLATLEGEFKIMTARDWSELSFGRNSSTEYITPGVPYEMTAWTDANIVVNGTLSNVTLQLTYVNQVATITVIENNPGGGGEQPQDTTIVPPVVDEVTVYTLMPEGWAALNAYVWPDEGTNYVAWPGEVMTPTGLVFRNAAVYSYTFPANYTHIIFNNGEGGQTANLDVNPATPCYYDNAWHATFEATPVDTTGGGEQPQDTTSVTPGPQDTTEVAMITYYAVNSPRWPMPYAYVWKGESDAYKPWPGETMTRTGENFRGYEVYSYTMPAEYTKMIINNGKGGKDNQTPDMVLDTTLRYMYNLQWYASLEAIPADQQDTTGGEPQDTTIVTAERYYLVGMFNNWDASAAVEFQNMDSLYTLTLDTLKGEFKVIDAQDWAHNIYGAWSAFDIPLGGNYGLFNSTKSVNLTLDGDYTNVTLNLKKNGDDLFLFFVDGTLIPQDTTATPEPQDSTDVEMITYYAVNTPRWLLPYAYVWKGESESYRPWPGEAMEQTGINFRGYEVYSYTMPKEFTKMVINNAKGGDNNQTPDMVLDTTLRYMYNLQWYASLEAIPADQQDTTGGEPQDTTTVAEITVYTVMPEGWAALNAYVWPDQGTNYVAWPGEAMTPTGLVFRNAAVYSYTFPANYTHIIFNNGEGGQTANLDVNPATPYFYKGEWYASWDEVPEVEPQPQPAEAHYYLVGGFNSWNQNTAIEFSRQDSVYTVTIDTLFGSMKVLVSRETWEGNYGVPSQDDAALTLGEPKALVAYIDGVSYSYDFNVEGTILNAVLNFVVTENGATITLVSGTPYVAPIEDTHYYFIGSVNSWNFETAPEFTYADSIYTLSLDSLYGNFKVTGAHDWNHGNYGAHTSGDVLLLGGEYQMASANSQDLWVDGTYTNVVLALTNTNNILTIHFVQGTLVQDTVAPQPQPENYYIKNNWNGGEWAWRQMEEVVGMSDDTIVTFWGYTDVFGGVGVNISTAGDNTEPDTWYAINDFIIADGDLVPQAMDSVSFIYDAVNHLVYAFVINRPGVDPLNPDTIVPQPEKHYYLVGQFNGWDVTTAPEFVYQDAVYTLTVDTLLGEFKVVGARDWVSGNYGAYNFGDVLNMGGEYIMWNDGNSQNLNVSGVYTNVTLNLTYVNNVVTIYFVSGTLVPTGLDTTVGNNSAATMKVIENGNLYILRDGKKYNAEGQLVR